MVDDQGSVGSGFQPHELQTETCVPIIQAFAMGDATRELLGRMVGLETKSAGHRIARSPASHSTIRRYGDAETSRGEIEHESATGYRWRAVLGQRIWSPKIDRHDDMAWHRGADVEATLELMGALWPLEGKSRQILSAAQGEPASPDRLGIKDAFAAGMVKRETETLAGHDLGMGLTGHGGRRVLDHQLVALRVSREDARPVDVGSADAATVHGDGYARAGRLPQALGQFRRGDR